MRLIECRRGLQLATLHSSCAACCYRLNGQPPTARPSHLAKNVKSQKARRLNAKINTSDPGLLLCCPCWWSVADLLSSGEPLSLMISGVKKRWSVSERREILKAGRLGEAWKTSLMSPHRGKWAWLTSKLRLESYRAVGKETKSASSSRWNDDCNPSIWEEDKHTLALWLMSKIYSL